MGSAPTPPANSTQTTLQVGTYSALADSFTPVFDLNDLNACWLHNEGLLLPQPEKTFVRGSNVRTPGEYIPRFQYKNRHISASVWFGRGLTTTQILSTVRKLLAAIERPPYVLRIALPGATQYSYADVVAVTHTIPADPQIILNGALTHVEIDFECRPFFRGDRVTLSNLVANPGFEAPFGGGTATVAPVAFADSLTNLHAYGDPGYEAAVLADAPLRYYPMDELAGTAATNLGSEGAGSNGTYQGATLGVSGSIGSGSGDYAVSFSGSATSNLLGPASAALPSGSSAWTMEVWLKLAAYPGANTQICSFGVSGSGNNAQLNVNNTGLPAVNISGGFTQQQGAAALTLNAWHHLVGTYSGGTNGTLTLYVDGAQAASGAISGTPAIGASASSTVGSNIGQGSFLACTADDFAIYGAALSVARVSAHYSANSAANNPILAPANTYVDAVLSTANGGGNLLRYYRLDEASGTSAYDIAGTGQTATYHGTVTFGVAGALAVDTDTAVTLDGSTAYVSCPVTNLPRGNAAISFGGWCKFAANPAATKYFVSYGPPSASNHQYMQIGISSTGHATLECGAATITSSGVLGTGTWHLVVGTWDGTTMTLYVDGASAGTATPGAQAIPTSNVFLDLGVNVGGSAFFAGQLDEVCMWGAALSSSQVSNLYTAGHSGASGTLANSMLVPAGTLLQFGSSAWGAIQTWQMRFRWVEGLIVDAYLHYTNANNALLVAAGGNPISGHTLSITQVIGGTGHQVASSAITLTNGDYFWLSVTQFPAPSGVTPYVQATLYYDADGAVGSQLAQVGAFTFDAVTALSGQSALSASGAALVVGGTPGNASGAGQQVSLFGPGGWVGAPRVGAGTTTAALAWEQNTANTAPLGNSNAGAAGGAAIVQVPVESFGAARIDAPPTGAWSACWQAGTTSLWSTFYPLQATAIPVAVGGDVLNFSCMLKASGNGTGYGATAVMQEYNAAGTLLHTTTQTLATGSGAVPWQAANWSLTTQSTTAFVILQLGVSDATSSSAGSTTWFDNVQCWDPSALVASWGTYTQATMPYCELRYPTSPAQLVVSGLLGSVTAPAAIALGFDSDAALVTDTTVTLMLGRRGSSGGPRAQLVQVCYSLTAPLALDSLAYGGYDVVYPAGTTAASPRVFVSSPGDQSGFYDLVTRAQTGQSSGNLGNLNARIIAGQVSGALSSLSSSPQVLAAYYSAYLNKPFAYQNAWTVMSVGPLWIPIFAVGSLVNPATYGLDLNSQFTDATSGGSSLQANWQLLLPADGSLLVGTFITPSNASPPATFVWAWVYADEIGMQQGQAPAVWTWGTTTNGALPAPSAGVGGSGTLTSGYLNVNQAADSALTLDPTLGIVGVSAAAGGINQLAGYVSDDSGDVIEMFTEIAYSPLYLYPR